MHCPSTEPRQSLYHGYRVRPAWRPGAQAPARAGVVVVGAGPIGLTLALDLARHGVRVLLLEAEQQVSEGSRAIVFTRRSMEILQQVGVDRVVTAAGLPWHSGNSYYRGQRVYRMSAPQDHHCRHHPMINLQQPALEEALLSQVAAQPLIELRWGQRVTALLDNAADEGVRLAVDTPAGPYEQAADWVVACDGARSELRSLLGLKLEGASYEGRFVIADIQVDLPLPTERLAYFDPPWNPGNTVLMHRQPHRLWRVDYQLPPDETPEQALAPEALKARIDAQLAMIGHAGAPWTLDWCSVYSARALTLPDYQHGRVLFAGDAAHLLPIFGVRGANTGFQDAHNLGWKLAAAQRGVAGPGLLRSYSEERVAAAREIIAEAGKSTRFMTPPTRGQRLLRDAVLSLSLQHPFVGPLFHWRTSRPHDHADSRLNCRDDDNARLPDGPRHGAPLPDARLGSDDHLLDHLGAAFTLLHVADTGPLPDGVAEALAAWRARGVAVDVLALRRQPGVVDQARDTLLDPDGEVAARLGLAATGGTLLLRPDQHVCARWLSVTADGLDGALRQALAL